MKRPFCHSAGNKVSQVTVKEEMHTLNRGIVAGLVTAASASIFFAWLAHAVMTGTLAWFDLAVRDAIHSWASPNLTRAMRGVTQLGSWPFLVALGLATCWGLAKRGHIRATVMLAIAALGGEAPGPGAKNFLFRRRRPEPFSASRSRPTAFQRALGGIVLLLWSPGRDCCRQSDILRQQGRHLDRVGSHYDGGRILASLSRGSLSDGCARGLCSGGRLGVAGVDRVSGMAGQEKSAPFG